MTTCNADHDIEGDSAYTPPVHFLAVNRQGRDTCGTSHLSAAALVTQLQAMGWTRIVPDSARSSVGLLVPFRYEAKADTAERPNVNGVAHPTVKPIALMQWLVRLVTPPGGTVLEPFAGSGTTVEAAVREGFQCIAIEREADYLPLIVSRLNRPINHVMEFPA